MGISPSKQAETTLSSSSAFTAACESAYSHCLSLTQHAFPGVLPYQLPTASDQIHSTLTTTNKIPLIVNWVPTPPTQAQVDSALKVVETFRREAEAPEEEPMTLGAEEFKQWAVVLFADAVADKAGKALLQRVPIGVAGIVGIGAVARPGKNLVGAAIGLYALGVVTSVYLSLSG
ncbi:unnamed protein product [Linum tenue]|uniref:Transmembrane protein n=1 Tax=Linum tenue TaxID=586396 RepID=A0AAV0LXA6_9ROSI|nr:unnamed protein product [Linum tenue]